MNRTMYIIWHIICQYFWTLVLIADIQDGHWIGACFSGVILLLELGWWLGLSRNGVFFWLNVYDNEFCSLCASLQWVVCVLVIPLAIIYTMALLL